MPREYTPLPFEYFEEMQDLTDEEFGELMRALILYARDGKEISCKGKGNIFRVRLMHKDNHYAKANEEEQQRKAIRSKSARKSVSARYSNSENPQISGESYERIRSSTNVDNTNTNQSNPNQDQTKTNPKKDIKKNLRSSCSELCESSEPAEPPVIKIPLNDGSEFPVYQKDIDLWQETYQAVDVYQQLKEIRSWSDANPAKRKTQKGVRRFINMWLAKEQDKGGKAPGASPSSAKWQYGGARREVTLTEFE